VNVNFGDLKAKLGWSFIPIISMALWLGSALGVFLYIQPILVLGSHYKVEIKESG